MIGIWWDGQWCDITGVHGVRNIGVILHSSKEWKKKFKKGKEIDFPSSKS